MYTIHTQYSRGIIIYSVRLVGFRPRVRFRQICRIARSWTGGSGDGGSTCRKRNGLWKAPDPTPTRHRKTLFPSIRRTTHTTGEHYMTYTILLYKYIFIYACASKSATPYPVRSPASPIYYTNTRTHTHIHTHTYTHTHIYYTCTRILTHSRQSHFVVISGFTRF